ncbi:MAG: cytidine deaminase, partial [Phototrophicales bacterium]
MIDADDRRLIAAAASAAEQAYCPYSHYPVGAALEADDGAVFT